MVVVHTIHSSKLDPPFAKRYTTEEKILKIKAPNAKLGFLGIQKNYCFVKTGAVITDAMQLSQANGRASLAYRCSYLQIGRV